MVLSLRGVPMGGAGAVGERADQRSLRTLQSLLVRCLGQLIAYAYTRGYELTLGEGYIQSPRNVEMLAPVRCPRCAHDFEYRHKGFAVDRVHMPASLHHTRLAIDLNLFVAGQFITSGEHAAWLDLAAYWEALDPACCSGARFNDANHLSVTFGGKK